MKAADLIDTEPDPWADSADTAWSEIEEKVEAKAPGKYLVLLPQIDNPGLVFQAGGTDPLVERIKQIAREKSQGLDVSTPRSRAALKSLAYEIVRTNTGIDEAGKRYVAKLKEQAKVIDAERKRSREALDELRDEIRKPLTDWEDANKARVKTHYDALAEIGTIHQDRAKETVESVAAKLVRLAEIRARDWEEFKEAAMADCEAVEAALQERHATLLTARIEAEELAKLRREKAERERADYEARIAVEAVEKARVAAEEKVQRERDKAKQRAKADETARLAAEERAKQAEIREERERIASEERAKAESERQERLRVLAAERAVVVERERVDQERAKAAKIEADRIANEEHRERVEEESMEALAEVLGVRDAAAKVLKAIRGGDIPNVMIEY